MVDIGRLSSLVFLFAGFVFLVPTAEAVELRPVGSDLEYHESIERIVQSGIEAGEMPGAVVVVAGPSQVHYAKAFGRRSVEPEATDMTLDTLFDLASLTKPIATGTSVMKLVSDDKVNVEATVVTYLPEFKGQDKEPIRVRDLLLHIGGLIPDNSLRDYEDGPEEAWKRICDLKPIAAPGEKFAYTDVGFIVLGKLVERVSGQTLDVFAAEQVFRPLGMMETTYNPGPDLSARAAPTERRGDDWMRGEVHDPRAFRLGGVAGHAGLFSTAGDLVTYGQMMLQQGQSGAAKILSPRVFSMMTRPREIPRGTRTFGWDHRTGYSRNRGKSLSESAFGHGGFTGTVIWIDPEKQLVFVFLSNRLHPDGKGTINGLAGEIATLVGKAH